MKSVDPKAADLKKRADLDTAALKGLSKHMSRILRHEAEQLNLQLDPEGYVPIEALLAALQRAGVPATEASVRAVVETMEPRKQRFSLADGWIRANYGHSLALRIDHQPGAPVGFLYHGTTVPTRDKIMLEGLRPMGRQYVHLTPDADLARMVGGRHGKPCLLRVDAVRAHAEGIAFYQANRNFWLTDHVPPQYLGLD